jgi:hypothetical protein
MQTIEQLNESLLKLYEDILTDKVSLRKAMTAANVANTLLRGLVIQTQMCLPKNSLKQIED